MSAVGVPEGFRTLSEDELALVAGGDQLSTVFVDQPQYWDNPFPYEGDPTRDSDPDDGPRDDGDPEGNGLTDEETEQTLTALQALKSALEENIVKYGDPLIKLPNGDLVKASTLVDFIGKTMDILEAGLLLKEVAEGNSDVAAVAGFVAGLMGGAVAGALGAGPIAVFAAGAGAGFAVEYVLSELMNNLEEDWAEAFNQMVQQNPGGTPNENLYNLIMRALGLPLPGSGGLPGNPGGGGPGGGGTGGNLY